ncbi:MAG: SRPBCC family protein [Candidatus Methanofastidiosia archaeon]
MVKIEQSVVINRPVEEVFTFLSNPENELQYRSSLLEAEQTSEGPMGVGTTFREVEKFIGKRIESTYEVTEYETNKKYSFKTISGPAPGEVSMSFESVEGGTKVSFAMDFEIGGLFKLAKPVVIRMTKKQVDDEVSNLKDLLEAQG